jgi:uncharacterized protein (TIGR02246 family)
MVDAKEQIMANQTSNEAEVRAVVERWAAAIRNADMDGVLAQHADNVVMFDVPEEAKGMDAYKKTWVVFFKHQGKGDAFDLDELEITAGDEVAFCHSIVMCGGKEKKDQFPVRLTVGLKKQRGQWVIAHEHHSVVAE